MPQIPERIRRLLDADASNVSNSPNLIENLHPWALQAFDDWLRRLPEAGQITDSIATSGTGGVTLRRNGIQCSVRALGVVRSGRVSCSH